LKKSRRASRTAGLRKLSTTSDKPPSYRFRLSALKERLEAEPATARCTEIIRLAKRLSSARLNS
jgi:hypothetical protein